MNLTHRQKQIVSGIAASMTTRQIGTVLGISAKTVEDHIHRIQKWLGIAKRTKGSYTPYVARFTIYAYENHLIKIGAELGSYIDGYRCDCDVCRGSFRNEVNRLNLGQSRHERGSGNVLCVLHGKPDSPSNQLAFAGGDHKPRSYQRRSATRVHELHRSGRVSVHYDGE